MQKASTPSIWNLRNTLMEVNERHRSRNSPSGFDFCISDRIDFLNKEHWNALSRHGSVLLDPEVLRVLEQHGPENLLQRYAMIYRSSKPVAILVAQVVTITGELLQKNQTTDLSSGVLKKTFRKFGQKIGKNYREKILIGGNLLSTGFHGIQFAQDEDPKYLWPGIAEVLYRIRRAEKLSGQSDFVMVKDITSRELGLESLHRFSYRPLQTEPNMVLDINPEWKTYEDYLAALDAKYRRNSKDQLKKLSASGSTIETLINIEEHSERLHELYLAVQSNASVRLSTLRSTFFPMLAKVLGPRFRCNVIRRENQILGFATSFKDGDTANAYFIGFDRQAASEGVPLYLRLLHSTVGNAIEWKCRKLSLGRTALEPKAALGARPEPMSVWIRHRVPVVNWVFRSLLDAVPHEEPPDRTPFKAAPLNTDRSSLDDTPQ